MDRCYPLAMDMRRSYEEIRGELKGNQTKVSLDFDIQQMQYHVCSH